MLRKALFIEYFSNDSSRRKYRKPEGEKEGDRMEKRRNEEIEKKGVPNGENEERPVRENEEDRMPKKKEAGWRKEGERMEKRGGQMPKKKEAGWRKEGSRMEKRGRPDGEKEEGRNREKKRCRMEKKGARADTEINLGVGPNFAPSP